MYRVDNHVQMLKKRGSIHACFILLPTFKFAINENIISHIISNSKLELLSKRGVKHAHV